MIMMKYLILESRKIDNWKIETVVYRNQKRQVGLDVGVGRCERGWLVFFFFWNWKLDSLINT